MRGIQLHFRLRRERRSSSLRRAHEPRARSSNRDRDRDRAHVRDRLAVTARLAGLLHESVRLISRPAAAARPIVAAALLEMILMCEVEVAPSVN